MKKTDRPVIKAVTKSHIKRLIKNFGLQSYMFDTSLFSLEWEGLEYRFKIMDGRLLLQSVAVCMDVVIGPMEKYERDIFQNWLGTRRC